MSWKDAMTFLNASFQEGHVVTKLGTVESQKAVELEECWKIIRFLDAAMVLGDVRILGMRDDNWLVSDVVALNVQSAASIASVGHRLIAKSHKMQVLRAQLVAEQNLVYEYHRDIKRLKKNRAKTAEENQRQLQILQEENEKLSKMVDSYSKGMQKQLEALENLGNHK
ncbi:unnamed protein product [Prunus armeniaca]